MTTKADSPVIIREIKTGNNQTIGELTLNAPGALNALNLDMIRLLDTQLMTWEKQSEVCCVILRGAGEKAFCAGGDVVSLYHAMVANPGQPVAEAQAFFSEEYQLDYRIHRYSKPIICWGSGIVMGGGLGLQAACRYSIATETTRLAMPEITIGLFPDVGGTWFLNRMPEGCGLYLGLTGNSLNGSDALFTGLARFACQADGYGELIDRLSNLTWPSVDDERHQCLEHFLEDYSETGHMPPSQVKDHLDAIREATALSDLEQIVAAITKLGQRDDWLARGAKTLQQGCPTTAHLVYAQLQRGSDLALDAVFKTELNMAMHCIVNGEFQEGVRALLIDKDRNPKWKYSALDAVPEAYINSHFQSLWPEGAHPLAKLGLG